VQKRAPNRVNPIPEQEKRKRTDSYLTLKKLGDLRTKTEGRGKKERGGKPEQRKGQWSD